MLRLIALATLLCAGSAQAALEARDINGDGTVDAYYDTEQNITWLADANYAATLGIPADTPVYNPPGALTVFHSASFVAGLDIFGVTGWRLFHQTLSPECQAILITSGFRCFGLAQPGSSELVNLYATLATMPGGSPFLNFTGGFRWSDSKFTACINIGIPCPSPILRPSTWFLGSDGTHEWATADELQNFGGFVWPVHDGDVSAIPEPETFALLLVGLAALVARSTVPRRPSNW